MHACTIRRQWPILAAATIMTACGGGGDGGTTGPVTQPVATVSVSLANSDIVVGQSTQASVTLRDASSTVLTGRTVTWSSSNTSVASVSSTGQVTGVGEGSANIIATSEGKSGQVALSVGPDPTTIPHITGLTVTQNGQAANLQQVAGTLDLEFTLDIPAGYSGTLSLTIDTVTLYSEAVSAPAVSARLTATAGEPAAVVASVVKTINAETAGTAFTVSADEIAELPKLRNGQYNALLKLSPGVVDGPSAEVQVTLTLANPPHATMLYRHFATPVPGTDGKSYTGGMGQGAVVFANYSNEPIDDFSIILTDYAAEYGTATRGAIPVYQRIDRTNTKFFDIPPAPIERAGLTWVLDKVTIGGNLFDPQATLLGGAITSNLDYSGWANSATQAQALTVPAGVRYVQAEIPSTNLFDSAPTHGIAGMDMYNLDNLGPHQMSGAGPVFTFLDRPTAIGADAFDQVHGIGALWNQISPEYHLGAGLHLENLEDITGIDQNTVDYFAAPIAQIDQLFTDQFKLSASYTFTGTNGLRSYVVGARVRDGRGNTSDGYLTTSAANRYRLDGTLSADVHLGFDIAAVGYNETPADLASSGVPRDFAWNTPTLDASWKWDLTATNSVVGLSENWLSMRIAKDGVWGYGYGSLHDRFSVQSAFGGATDGTASINVKQYIDLVNSTLGTTDQQGIYDVELQARDVSGLGIGSWGQPLKRRFIWDWTKPGAPIMNVNGSVIPGTNADGTLSGSDNVAVRRALIGFQFDYATPLFDGGKVYVPAGDVSIPTVNHAPVKSFNIPLGGIVPVGFWFYEPSGGAIDWGNFYRSSAFSAQLIDKAKNWGPITFAPFINTEATPSPSFISAVFAGLASTTWCPGTCAGGGTNSVDGYLRYHDTRLSGAPVLEKALVFGIPVSGGGYVYPLGKGTTFTETVAGGGRDIEFAFNLDLKHYCGPPGFMDVFVVAYSADRKWIMKNNPFFGVNVLAPDPFTNYCKEF